MQEHRKRLNTYENGIFVSRTVTTNLYYSIGAYQEGDSDIDDVPVATVADLWYMWQEMKRGDSACGERGWKYHFYRHEITTEENPLSGKPETVDYVTPGKLYRRGNKVFFKGL